MLEGSAVRIQGGEEIPVKKGDFWCSPGGIEHGVIGGPDGAVILDVFSPPRAEYTSARQRFWNGVSHYASANFQKQLVTRFPQKNWLHGQIFHRPLQATL